VLTTATNFHLILNSFNCIYSLDDTMERLNSYLTSKYVRQADLEEGRIYKVVDMWVEPGFKQHGFQLVVLMENGWKLSLSRTRVMRDIEAVAKKCTDDMKVQDFGLRRSDGGGVVLKPMTVLMREQAEIIPQQQQQQQPQQQQQQQQQNQVMETTYLV